MSNIGNYEERYKAFDWAQAQEHLGYKEGDFLNIGYYCSDRICDQGKADKLALIWEGSDGTVKKYTFNDIRVLSNTYAKFLKDSGIEKGDRVCIFMDRIPDLYISLLGILKIGAIAQPLFSAFGPESLITRLANAETKAVLTTRKHVSKVRKIKSDLPALEHVIIVDGEPKKKVPGEIVFELEKAEPVEEFESFAADLETPSILHYTSGTTGQPKGALHVHSAIFAQAITTQWVLDLKDSDIYWCTADPGWVTGTSYGIIGPWSLGITKVVLDAGFIPDRWYKLIADHKITVWYSAPTAIRMLMKQGTEIIKMYDFSSLRHLCSVGEPLNAEAVHWSREAYGLPFNDNFWQTETGSIVISNYPGMEIKPGSMGRPFPGITATVLDLKTHEPITEPGKVGLIALKPGWPSMFRAYWRNQEVYKSKFDKGWYICGDRASIDKDGYFWFVGRDDDVINTGGHLVGPFEIESALLEHPAVAESAAVGKPDEVNMEVVKAFVALKPGFEPSDDLELNIMNFIRKRLSPLAMPQEIEFVSSLPKTRSGKIMHRVLRAQEWGEEVGDISTLEND